MHGLHDAQFLNKVASFLGPYYIVLALMNGVAALYLWRTGRARTWFTRSVLAKVIPDYQRIVWLLVAFVFMLMSPLAGSGMPGVDAVDAGGVARCHQPQHWPGRLQRRHGRAALSFCSSSAGSSSIRRWRGSSGT